MSMDDALLDESDEDLTLLDDDASETESLTGSIIELLDSESLGSLKELFKPSTKPQQQQHASPPPVPAAGAKTTHVVKKLKLKKSPRSPTVTKSSQSATAAVALKSQAVLITKRPRKRSVPVATMPDLREILNRKKKRKSQQLGMATVNHNNIFPNLPVGIELNCKTHNSNPLNHMYSFDHL